MLLGNHRDAWVYGAVDPSSGTAVMLEIARVMGQLVKQGNTISLSIESQSGFLMEVTCQLHHGTDCKENN